MRAESPTARSEVLGLRSWVLAAGSEAKTQDLRPKTQDPRPGTELAQFPSNPWYTVWEPNDAGDPIVCGPLPPEVPATRDPYADSRPEWQSWDDQCDGTCQELEAWNAQQQGTLGWWLRDLSVYGGVDGFKGPFDLGHNGNFGFHEGANFGAPLGFWDWGWQLGFTAVHTNLSGDSALEARSSGRNQFFLTGGIFHRVPDWGFQWGVTYDWLHDEYYARADLKQIRSDTSFLLPGGTREIGYFGAYGTGGTSYVLLTRQLKYYIFMDTTDIFAFYYRRYFSGGGDGRLWLGFSGNGDGLLGGEIRVPMGRSWALENRMNYLIPKHGRGPEGESWGVTIQLVWYPGQPARCVRYHPYRPMLNVADNTLFMTDTFVPPPSRL
jgi:hypothetical protein